jgi:uncharacterized protein YjbI with pentapeptide repeats
MRMNEMSRLDAAETETPVNPYSLLEAVNRSSNSANTAWLIYLGLVSYLLITLAGIGHKQLLLNSDITLPILQVKIELTRFFLFAPILLVLIHMGLVGQLVLLARKTLEFAAAIRMLESTDQRTHPLRLELDNFFFVQAIAGPERSRIVSFLLKAMGWLTLVVMPLLLLLYIQLAFLPYHDVAITSVHRLALLADVALLAFVGVFLWRLETSFFSAFWRAGRHHPLSLTATALLLAAVAAFSLFVATIPGEGLDAAARPANGRPTGQLLGYVVPGLYAAPEGALLGLFPRNLSVTDADLVADKDVTAGEPSLNLRGRDLRNARLDRTDLHQADLTGADLEGASFVGTDLRGAWLGCADLNQLLLTDSRSAARCASARGANLSKARLSGARMAGIDLRGARLEAAQLDGAQLAQALLAGANLAGARLDLADLTGASLHGVNLLLGSLQGADLAGAKLQGADLTSASLQGANLSLAGLEGALLRDAELDGASLRMASLLGADLSGARLQGSDLSGAHVWRTRPPGGESSAFADMALVVLRPASEEELASLSGSVAFVEDGPLRQRMADAVAALGDAGQNAAWTGSPEQQLWQGYARSAADMVIADGYRTRLTESLTRLMCRPRFASGAVAAGVARRAMADGFKGDMPAIYDRLRAADCPASSAVGARVLRDLATAADTARGQ